MKLTVFWRWWTAGTTSQLGSAVGGVALPLTALTVLHASAFEMGLITAAGYLAYLLISLPAGVIVQRLPLRGTQVGADLVRALAVVSIPAAWWFDALTIAQLAGVALVISFASVLFDVANQTFLPEFYLVRELHAAPGLVGLLLAADGLGTLIGAALTTRFTNRVGTARGLLIAGGTGVTGALLLPWGSGTAGYLAFATGTLVFAGSVVVLSVTTRTYRMIASPPELLSRVIATVKFVSWGAIPVGGLVAGALAGPLGARTTLLIFGVVTVCVPVIWAVSPVRGLRDLPMDADLGPRVG